MSPQHNLFQYIPMFLYFPCCNLIDDHQIMILSAASFSLQFQIALVFCCFIVMINDDHFVVLTEGT